MNSKTLLYIVLVLSLTTTFVIVGIYAVLQIDPTLLGYPPKAKDTMAVVHKMELAKLDSLKNLQKKLDTVYVEPKLTITQEQFDKFQEELLKKDLLAYERDSLRKLKMKLLDSITKIYANVNHFSDYVKKIRDTMAENRKDYSLLNDSLRKYHELYKKTQGRLKLAEDKIKSQQKILDENYDTLEIKNFRNYAKIYNNTDPVSVARILEKIDEKDASMILKFMSKRKAGKVLDKMKSEQAAAILLLGAESGQQK